MIKGKSLGFKGLQCNFYWSLGRVDKYDLLMQCQGSLNAMHMWEKVNTCLPKLINKVFKNEKVKGWKQLWDKGGLWGINLTKIFSNLDVAFGEDP